MKTLFEFEDGEDLYLNQTQWFMESQRVLIKPRRMHREYPELMKEIQAEYREGKYPRVGYLIGVYKDEDGGEWILIYFEKEDQERIFKTEFWAWS